MSAAGSAENAVRRRVGVLRAPNGCVIADIYDEGGIRVAERHVTQARHLYRGRNAWTLGERALLQARTLRVELLRYVTPTGTYEVAFPVFAKEAERIGFAHEAQFVLPRHTWRFTPLRMVSPTTTPTSGAKSVPPASKRTEQLMLISVHPTHTS